MSFKDLLGIGVWGTKKHGERAGGHRHKALGNRKRRPRPLRVESLEDRQMMSISPSNPAVFDFTHMDVNGDGKSDLMWRRADDTGEARIWGLSGATVSVDLGLPAMPAGWKIVGIGDFNGDGKADLVWRRTNDTGETQIWELDNGRVIAQIGLPLVPLEWKIVGIGDFNGDGKSDLAWRRSDDTGEVRIWQTRDCNLFTDIGLAPAASGSQVVGIGDFNGDGKSDLVWRQLDNTDCPRIWEMNGGNVIANVALPAVPSSWSIIGVGDFNGDGKSDLVWRRSNGAGEARIWQIDNGNLSGDIGLPSVSSSWKVVGIGDFNGDGKSDLVWRRSDDTGEARIWQIKDGRIIGDIGLPWVDSSWKVVDNTQPADTLGLRDSYLSSLTQSLLADGSLSRADMIRILRSAGSDDGVVDQAELISLQTIVASATSMGLTDAVRVLGSNVVNGNTANASYQGSCLGNLVVGSSDAQLTKLIDKWFLGADHPMADANGSYSYATASGSLFVNGPTYTDMHQGYLGDCYYIASLGAIAKSSPTAITNMFTDNGDGTWTVRFYYQSGSNYVADYVTVDNMLPVSGSRLIYSGSGSIRTSTSNELWMALAEKAYAQWNETGREGRDGTNTYSAIEGGWMTTVNSQILGFKSRDYYFYDSYKQTLINAIASNKSVTLGTSVAADGLFNTHAYMVLSYNSSNDTFQLYNPWGTSHPGALTWTQLKADCFAFVIADAWSPASSSSGQSAAMPLETPLVPTEHPQAIGFANAGKTNPEKVPADSPKLPPSDTLAVDACLRDWNTESQWFSRLQARRLSDAMKASSPLELESSFAS